MHTQIILVWLTMDCSRPFNKEPFYSLCLLSDRWCDVTGFVLACNLSSVSSCSTLLICRDISHWWWLFCPSIFTENYYCYDPNALVNWHQRAFQTIDLYVNSSPYISSYCYDPAWLYLRANVEQCFESVIHFSTMSTYVCMLIANCFYLDVPTATVDNL